MSTLEKYGYGLRPNALAADAITYDTSNVLAGIPKGNQLSDALRATRNAIPENPDHSVSMLNMVRGGLGSAANWLEGAPKIGPDTLAPMGASVMTSMGLNAFGAIPKNAAGIFGGRIAANRLAEAGRAGPRGALDLAESMQARGASMSEIRAATNAYLAREAPEFGGVHLGRDGKWRFEIDDRGLSFNPSADWRSATDHFPHGIFEQAYPEARRIDSMVATGDAIKSAAGYVEDLGTAHPSMMVRTPTAEQARRIAAHEFQHVAQATEGFDFGSSPAAVMRSPLYGQFVSEIRKSPTYRKASHDAQKAAEEELARRLYTYLAGEVEAENVAGRIAMSPEQRRAIPPSETESVPHRSQFLLRDLWPE